MKSGNIRKNNRIRSGFTLVETLGVVVILIVLTAVAISFTPDIKARLTQKEMDNKAEIIFNAIQSNLTYLKESDQEKKYQDERYIHKFPSNQTLEIGVSFDHMCYVVAHENEDFTKTILPQNATEMELWSSQWIVVYNYSSGTVYGVFYSKEKNLSSLSFENMRYLCGYPNNKGFSNRVAYGATVGYYGGGDTGYLEIESIKNEKPEITLTNEETAYADFKCENFTGGGYKIEYIYTLSQPDFGMHYSDKLTTDHLVIDDLSSDKTRFKYNFSTDGTNCDLIPGAKTYITVRALINGIETKESDAIPFNGLFDDATTGIEVSTQGSRQIVISYGRHLQNLSMASGVDYTKIKTYKAVQTANIGFGKGSKWYEEYESKQFEPVVFKSNSNCLEIYNGNAKTISNINIACVDGVIDNINKSIKGTALSKDKYGTGIFASFWGSQLTAIRINGATVENTQTSRIIDTGIIAGKVIGSGSTAKISYCTVVGSNVKISSGNAGAIAGSIQNCDFEKINTYPVTTAKTTVTTKNGCAGFVAGTISGTKDRTINFNTIWTVPVEIKSENSCAGFVSGTVSYVNKFSQMIWHESFDADTKKNLKIKITAADCAGGIFGYEGLNTVTTQDTFLNIEYVYLRELEIESSNNAGGYIGESSNIKNIDKGWVKNSKITSNSCATDGRKRPIGFAGGIAGSMKNVILVEDIKVDNCEILSKINDAGGMAGYVNNCTAIKSSDVTNCTIEAELGNAGGFIGQAIDADLLTVCTTKNSSVKSNVLSKNAGFKAVGGIIGLIEAEDGVRNQERTSLDNIIVFDTKIAGDRSRGSAGGIIGRTCKLTTVQYAYLDIAGSNEEKTAYRKDKDKYNWSMIDGYYAGGTIGEIKVQDGTQDDNYVKIINTNASTVIGQSGTKYSGGLVGTTNNNLLMQKSYSCSYVRGNQIAGLVANAYYDAGIKAEYCYSAGYLDVLGSNSKSAGLMLAGDSDSSVESVKYSYTVSKTNSSTNHYSTAIKINSADKVYYAEESTSGKSNFGGRITQSLLKSKTDFKKVLGEEFSTESISTPYNLDEDIRSSGGYQFPIIKRQDYNGTVYGNTGDWYPWKESDLPGGGPTPELVYFENYSQTGSTLGMYVKDGNANNCLSETEQIWGDGYALVLDPSYNQGKITLKLESFGSKNATKDVNVKDISETLVGSTKWRFLDITNLFSLKTTEGISNVYAKLTVTYTDIPGLTGSETFYFNPRTAKSTVKSATEPSKVGTYYLRTPRHIYELAQTYWYYGSSTTNSSYIQERDIDYNNYSWSTYAGIGQPTSQYPIGMKSDGSEIDFTAKYDGGYHEIKGIVANLSGKKVKNLGFFTSVGNDSKVGWAINLYLVNEVGKEKEMNCDYALYAGIMAGTVGNKGYIKNCAVTGFKIVHDYDKRKTPVTIGGFAGYVKGNIFNCEANIRQMEIERYWSSLLGGFIGGFVGHSDDALIYNCCVCACMSCNSGTGGDGGFSGFAGVENGSLSDAGIYNSFCASYYGDNIHNGFENSSAKKGHNCYFLINVYKTGIADTSYKQTIYVYGQSKTFKYSLTYAGANPAKLSTISNSSGAKNFPEKGEAWAMAVPAYTKYAANNKNCTVVATVKDKNGNYIKFGEWPSSVASPSTSVSITASMPSTTMMAMTAQPLYVSVVNESTGENITDSVPLNVTSTSKSVTIVEQPNEAELQNNNEQPSDEAATEQNTENLQPAKVFMVYGANPGKAEINISLKGTAPQESETIEEEVSAENIENEEAAEEQTVPDQETGDTEGSDNQKEKIVVNDTLYEYEPVVIETTVEYVRHVGISEMFTEETKYIENDVVLPREESDSTFTNESKSAAPYEIETIHSLQDDNASMFIYSVDGFGLDGKEGSYDVSKIEVIRHKKPNLLTDLLDTAEEAEENADESFVILDKSVDDEWNFDDYYCRLGKVIKKVRVSSNIYYLPVVLTGTMDNPVTVKFTLTHNNETVVLSCDLESVQNKFKVTYKNGYTKLVEKEVEYGANILHPTAEEFDSLKLDKTGYIYPEYSVATANECWDPKKPDMICENITFSTVRKPITYTIVFDSNGGAGTMDPITVEYDSNTEIPQCTFTNESKVMTGWSLSPGGNAEIFRVADNLSSTDSATVTLYAVWEDAEKDEEEIIIEEISEPPVEGWA